MELKTAPCAACRCELQPDEQYGLRPNGRIFCGPCVDALVDLDKHNQRRAKRAQRRFLAKLAKGTRC